MNRIHVQDRIQEYRITELGESPIVHPWEAFDRIHFAGECAILGTLGVPFKVEFQWRPTRS